jgi:hypothetical protein
LNDLVLHEWLERWDRHNQAITEGKVPDSIRAVWCWDRGVDGAGSEQLSLGGVMLNVAGVQNGRWFWEWERIAFVTSGNNTRNPTVGLGLFGAPRIQNLRFGYPLSVELSIPWRSLRGPRIAARLRGVRRGPRCACVREARRHVDVVGWSSGSTPRRGLKDLSG